MKYIILICASVFLFACNKGNNDMESSTYFADKTVEASCGQCQFNMEGEGCDLAVRIDGQAYWVDGTGLDDHGDAHAEDGFCEAVRQAKVTGSVKEGRFHAKSFELLLEQKN